MPFLVEELAAHLLLFALVSYKFNIVCSEVVQLVLTSVVKVYWSPIKTADGVVLLFSLIRVGLIQISLADGYCFLFQRHLVTFVKCIS